MKIQIVGDTHCELAWKDLVRPDDHDLVIFLGDYVDSPFHTDSDMIISLVEVIKFKRRYGNVRTLLGNHDFHYAYPYARPSGGFRPQISMEVGQMFRENEELFDLVAQVDNHLFSHAGLTAGWWKHWLDEEGTEAGKGFEALNDPANRDRAMVSAVSPYRGGQDYFSGPLWCDIEEMKEDGGVPGIIQHVGHSRTKKKKTLAGKGWECNYYNYPFDKGLTTIETEKKPSPSS